MYKKRDENERYLVILERGPLYGARIAEPV
jgi:hypothetical protein